MKIIDVHAHLGKVMHAHPPLRFMDTHAIEKSVVLLDVNTDILPVLYPLDVAPMGPLAGDPHRLRPERNYPVWRSRLPEGVRDAG